MEVGGEWRKDWEGKEEVSRGARRPREGVSCGGDPRAEGPPLRGCLVRR